MDGVQGLQWGGESCRTFSSPVEVRWVPGSYLLCQCSASPGSLARIHSRWPQSFLLPAEWEKWINVSPG